MPSRTAKKGSADEPPASRSAPNRNVAKPTTLTKEDLCFVGLQAVWLAPAELSGTKRHDLFRKHYGSLPCVLLSIWNDITSTNTDIPFDTKKRERKALIQFFVAMYWLWTYPRSAELTAAAFGMKSTRNCQGKPLWTWIGYIAGLVEKKVVWSAALDDPNTAIFAITVDGADFRTWEPKHPTLPVDRKFCSHKYKHGAVRYEIALSIFTNKCVWVSDPYPAGVHDMTIFRSGLKKKVKHHKLVVADRGYQTSELDERFMSTPNAMDSKAVAKFKSQARCRQESFNGRLKNFACLRDTYRHDLHMHKRVLQAVVVIVQTQMDFGASLFEV